MNSNPFVLITAVSTVLRDLSVSKRVCDEFIDDIGKTTYREQVVDVMKRFLIQEIERKSDGK